MQDDQPPVAELIEHGDLFGDADRIGNRHQWAEEPIFARLTICVSAPASGATEGARMSGE